MKVEAIFKNDQFNFDLSKGEIRISCSILDSQDPEELEAISTWIGIYAQVPGPITKVYIDTAGCTTCGGSDILKLLKPLLELDEGNITELQVFLTNSTSGEVSEGILKELQEAYHLQACILHPLFE